MSYAPGAPPVQFDPTTGQSYYGTAPKPQKQPLPPVTTQQSNPATDPTARMPVVQTTGTRPAPQVVPFRDPPMLKGEYGGPGITGGPDPNAIQTLSDFSQRGPSGGYSIEGSPGVTAAYRTPTGASLAQDPSLKAAVDAFNAYQRPTIENQMQLAGLGRSNATGNATALALGQQLPQFMESAFGREENAVTRGAQATENELNRRQQLDINQSNANLATIPLLQEMGNQDYQRQLGQIGQAENFGSLQRGVEQESNDAAYQDFLRRQGLTEQGTFGPFGQVVPSAFGSRSLTSKS